MNVQAHKPASEICVLPTAQDDIISDYAAGHLSPAKHAITSCAIELNAALRGEDNIAQTSTHTFIDKTSLDKIQ